MVIILIVENGLANYKNNLIGGNMKKKIIVIILIISILCIIVGLSCIVIASNTKKSKKVIEDPDEVMETMSRSYPNSDYYKKSNDGTLVNISKNIKKIHTNGDFSIDKMTITYNEDNVDLANYSYVITNNGVTNYDSIDIRIVFIFSDGSKIYSSPSTIQNLTALGSSTVERKDFLSIVGAVDYEIKVGPFE